MVLTNKLALVVILTSLIGGCGSGTKESLLPQDGPTMDEVYRGHNERMEGAVAEDMRDAPVRHNRSIQTGSIDLEGYTRTANNEIESIFPRLPNPTLVMYVYPHLTHNSRLPVPGYSTSFPMYERPEYALPGER